LSVLLEISAEEARRTWLAVLRAWEQVGIVCVPEGNGRG
jgi:hypothetical protein